MNFLKVGTMLRSLKQLYFESLGKKAGRLHKEILMEEMNYS